MNIIIAKHTVSWLLLAVLTACFTSSCYYLLSGVLHNRIEGLMVGGTLMFAAVLAAWLRVCLHVSVERAMSRKLGPRADFLMTDPVRM